MLTRAKSLYLALLHYLHLCQKCFSGLRPRFPQPLASEPTMSRLVPCAVFREKLSAACARCCLLLSSLVLGPSACTLCLSFCCRSQMAEDVRSVCSPRSFACGCGRASTSRASGKRPIKDLACTVVLPWGRSAPPGKLHLLPKQLQGQGNILLSPCSTSLKLSK